MEKAEMDKSTVLYVDDSQPNLLLFKELFKNDFDILLASSAREGLEILRKEKVAVLVSDQSMPEMSGNELLEIVNEEFPDLPSFILTAYTDYDSLVESVNRGRIYGYFNKPIKYDEIKIGINKAVELSGLRARNREMISELERANKALLQLDSSRTQFLRMLTNEIRSPINKIMSAVNMIKDKVDSHDIAELLNLLDISVSRLESFTFATNQLARLKDVNKKIEHKKVSLRELIEISFIDKKNALDDTGISVSMNEDSPVSYVNGDYDLLLSCMGILLMNLVNNMNDGGSLDFKTGQLNGSTWVDIKVKNPGYTLEQIKTLENVLSGSGADESHFGLELILSKEIITSHKGKIKFEEKGEGSFTTRLLFPSCKTD